MKGLFEITGIWSDREAGELHAISLNIWNESSKELLEFVLANFKKPVEVEIKEAVDPGNKQVDTQIRKTDILRLVK